MLTLIQYGPAFGTRSASPFCTKAEMLLKLSGRPFQLEIWKDPRKAPKGKLPLLRDGNELIADSTFIRKHLERRHGCRFDARLAPEQLAIADAFTKLVEEHLYWAIVQMRWWEEDNWARLAKAYFGGVPALIRPLVLRVVRKEARAQIRGHGMGRHTREEIYELGADDLRSVSAFLADKPYFMGASLSAVDATAYAFLAAIIDCELPGVLKVEAERYANLRAYCERIGREVFGGSD